jgi:hypothetical protein
VCRYRLLSHINWYDRCPHSIDDGQRVVKVMIEWTEQLRILNRFRNKLLMYVLCACAYVSHSYKIM